MRVNHPIISADSHITEAPDTYTKYIEPKYRDIAPHIRETEDKGDLYIIDGMKQTIGMGLVAAAGQAWHELNPKARYSDIHRSGYDNTLRIADQDRDGVSCEILYPTVGMVLCNHPDFDYKAASMRAYNRWVAEYASVDTDRLIPLGQTAMQSPEQGIADLEEMKALGLRGVMMPGNPQVDDYDSWLNPDPDAVAQMFKEAGALAFGLHRSPDDPNSLKSWFSFPDADTAKAFEAQYAQMKTEWAAQHPGAAHQIVDSVNQAGPRAVRARSFRSVSASRAT